MPNFTKMAIKASFIKLLNERPLNQITVKDIVLDCGINRNTFYYHFPDIPTLAQEVITQEAEEIIKKYPTIDSLERCLSVAIEFALENKRAVLHLYNSVNRDLYEQYLMNVCDHVVTAYVNTTLNGREVREYDKQLLIRFFKCTCFGQTIEWMNGGMKEDIRIPFQRLCELSQGMSDEFFRRSMAAEDVPEA